MEELHEYIDTPLLISIMMNNYKNIEREYRAFVKIGDLSGEMQPGVLVPMSGEQAGCLLARTCLLSTIRQASTYKEEMLSDCLVFMSQNIY